MINVNNSKRKVDFFLTFIKPLPKTKHTLTLQSTMSIEFKKKETQSKLQHKINYFREL